MSSRNLVPEGRKEGTGTAISFRGAALLPCSPSPGKEGVLLPLPPCLFSPPLPRPLLPSFGCPRSEWGVPSGPSAGPCVLPAQSCLVLVALVTTPRFRGTLPGLCGRGGRGPEALPCASSLQSRGWAAALLSPRSPGRLLTQDEATRPLQLHLPGPTAGGLPAPTHAHTRARPALGEPAGRSLH